MDTDAAISSRESPDGRRRYVLPSGQMLFPFGQVLARVSHSVWQGKAKELPTSDTSGQSSADSLTSAALQSSLASRLQANLGANGSPVYALTWKEWDMPSGPPICALRASVRRTSGSDSTGWPTPMAQNPRAGSCDFSRQVEVAAGVRESINGRKLAGWPTARATDGDKNSRTIAGVMNEVKRKGRFDDLPSAVQVGGWRTPEASNGEQGAKEPTGSNPRVTLTDQVTGWATPQARDYFPAHSPEYIAEKKAQGHGMANLNDQVAGWATPTARDGHSEWGSEEMMRRRSERPEGKPLSKQVIGTMSNGSPAPTEKRGQLNPAFSCWLMGFRDVWLSCVDWETPSSRKSRRSS